jgi:hypothetical protein
MVGNKRLCYCVRSLDRRLHSLWTEVQLLIAVLQSAGESLVLFENFSHGDRAATETLRNVIGSSSSRRRRHHAISHGLKLKYA